MSIHVDGSRATLDERLDHLLTLQKGWDGYGARAINKEAIAKAREIAALLPGYDWQAVPCPSSAVQLETHNNGFDIEIYVGAAFHTPNI
jgi:hypothetical protein